MSEAEIALSPVPAVPAAEAAPPHAFYSSFESDAPAAPAQFAQTLGERALLRRLVDLLRRPDAPSPFALGLLAPAGGGKTSALNWLAQALPAPFIQLHASELAAEPERALAAALFRALSPRYAALAHDAAQDGAHIGSDSGGLARAAQEKLEILRKKLVSEKLALAHTQERRAALAETMLYDTPGSRVDVFARRMRAHFEPRLRRFGFSGDALASFKDLTRDLNETGGTAARVGAALRVIYDFPGQTRLLLLAAGALGLNWGTKWLVINRPIWLGFLSASSSFGDQTAEFLQKNLDWLPLAAQIFGLLGLACLALNLLRSFLFMQPLVHAAGLLDEDVAAKGQELDQIIAHQARNVDLLGAETNAVARHAAEAERRALAASAPRHPPVFVEADLAAQKRAHARGFLHCLSAMIAGGATVETPPRLVVAVDGFEGLPEPAALFDRLHELLARPGLVALFALDPKIFGGALENGARRLQLPLLLDADPGEPAPAFAPLDAPLTPLEQRLLGALSPLAGVAPRAQKRLRNFYRFLRPAADSEPGLAPALAFVLAADLGASQAELRALAFALRGGEADFVVQDAPRLNDFLTTTRAICGPVSRDAARRAAHLAAAVSLR